MINQVPLLDLNAQYSSIEDEIRKVFDEVLQSKRFVMGPQVQELEADVAKYCNARHAIGCASGSDALLLSLMAAGVGHGDEVITTPYTFFATAGAISRLGAKPIFVDIDPLTYNIDPNSIEDVFQRRGNQSRIKAIIPVHLYGQSADMDPIMDIARRYNCVVIEDAAQAIGTEYKGRKVGSISHFGCFSFFPSKNLGCLGDGGMITTNDDEYADKLRVLRLHGSKPKYYHKVVGCNSRLDALQAAFLKVKLPHLDSWTEGRQKNANWYTEAFAKSGLVDRYLVTPYITSGGRHIYNQYVLRVRDRDGLMAVLKEKGIGTEVYYPVPLHLQECFADLGYKEGDLPHSEEAAKETLAIPIYPELTEEQKCYVVDTIKGYYKEG
jgi:dTDP-4-amino-4,6-dideoxygalactose transaminase